MAPAASSTSRYASDALSALAARPSATALAKDDAASLPGAAPPAPGTRPLDVTANRPLARRRRSSATQRRAMTSSSVCSGPFHEVASQPSFPASSWRRYSAMYASWSASGGKSLAACAADWSPQSLSARSRWPPIKEASSTAAPRASDEERPHEPSSRRPSRRTRRPSSSTCAASSRAALTTRPPAQRHHSAGRSRTVRAGLSALAMTAKSLAP